MGGFSVESRSTQDLQGLVRDVVVALPYRRQHHNVPLFSSLLPQRIKNALVLGLSRKKKDPAIMRTFPALRLRKANENYGIMLCHS